MHIFPRLFTKKTFFPWDLECKPYELVNCELDNRVLPMNKKSFTLLELMVVIAIIGILITMLLPSLSKARAQAQAAVCISNQKQLFIVTNFFMNSYDGKIPPVTNGTNSTEHPYVDMFNETGSYSGNSKAKYQRYMGFLNDNDKGYLYDNDVIFWRKIKEEDAIYKCPTDERVQIGSTELRTASYGPNINLWQHWGSWKSQDPLLLSPVEKPSEAVLMGDRTGGMYIRDWDINLEDELYYGFPELKDDGIVLRHPRKSAIFTYVDGHVQFQYWPNIRTTAGN